MQPLREGVTVIFPTKLFGVPLGGAFQAGIFPEPLAARPILVFEFVQVKEAPGGTLTKFGILI